MNASISRYLSNFTLGAVTVLGFAPISWFWLPCLTLAFWFNSLRTATRREAFKLGFAFGFGLFGAGVSWVAISLHDFGGMPLSLAIAATGLLCSYLALFPALAAWLTAYAAPQSRWKYGPFLWVATEWWRSSLLGGFPWLGLGYTQVSASPLAGYAPVFGAFGVSLVTACVASLLAQMMLLQWQPAAFKSHAFDNHFVQGAQRLRRRLWVLLLSMVLIGAGLSRGNWSYPLELPFTVSLLQGNIDQRQKWQNPQENINVYLDLLLQTPKSTLIVLPETALGMMLHEIPTEVRSLLRRVAQEQQSHLLFGSIVLRADGRYTNSVVGFGREIAQQYDKRQLVPFGEFIPWGFRWFVEQMQMPFSDFLAGETNQTVFTLNRQAIAVNICFEEAFNDLLRRELPAASLLVNVSNDAWFGRSWAAAQHLQIGQMRAAENARWVLRATNTGMTAVINPRGEIQKQLPAFSRGVLTASVEGRQGTTPFIWWGNLPIVLVCHLMILSLGWHARHNRFA